MLLLWSRSASIGVPAAVRQAADEAALLQPADEAVDAGFRLEAERLLHLLEGGRDAAIGQPTIDEDQQFMLFSRQHGRSPQARSRRILEQNQNPCDVLVWFAKVVKRQLCRHRSGSRRPSQVSSRMISTLSPGAAAEARGWRTTRQSARASSDIIALSCLSKGRASSVPSGPRASVPAQ